MVKKMKEISLQGIAPKNAIQVNEVKAGDVMICNFGYTQKIVNLTPSKSGKTYNVIIECNGKLYDCKMSATRYIALARLN